MTDAEVIFYGIGGGGTDKDGTVFSAFASDGEFTAVEVDRVAI